MDGFGENVEEIFDDVVDGVADAVTDIDATEVWEDVSEGVGDAKEEVQIVKEGGDITISFNVQYLQEAVAAVDTEDVRLEMTEENRAAVIKPTEGDGYLCVIMPMSNL